MAIADTGETDRAFIVVDALDGDGTVTLVECGTDESYRVVDYADDRLRERVADRASGSTLRCELVPVDRVGGEWKLTRVRPGAPVVPGAGASGAGG